MHSPAQSVVGTDVVERPRQVEPVSTKSQKAPHDAALVVLEVDVDDVVTGLELGQHHGEHEPGLASLGLARDGVDLAGIEQAHSVAAASHGRLRWLPRARQHLGEVDRLPGPPEGRLVWGRHVHVGEVGITQARHAASSVSGTTSNAMLR
jgi:hypothetical protein